VEAFVRTATRRLGRSDIEITPIGLGCMQFSGPSGLAARTFQPLDQDTVDTVVTAARAGGIGWFDTAEMYGQGHSERALTSALRADGVAPGDAVIATKWAPLARTAGNIPRSIDARLAALQGYPIDLYQIHEPYSTVSGVPALMRAMAGLVKAGKIRAVGVSNFDARRLQLAHDVLAAEGVALASNQVRISLLHRGVERNGVLETAKRLGITLIAYSPLANGVLTGRFHDDPAAVRQIKPVRRLVGRAEFGAKGLARTAPLVRELGAIADAHGVTRGQVALSWLVSAHGDTIVAIPGASKPRHATEAAGVLDLRLTDAEMGRLDELSRPLS
jgi:aryl-alcohol dehydrogenase-like predicted oxidoreductase